MRQRARRATAPGSPSDSSANTASAGRDRGRLARRDAGRPYVTGAGRDARAEDALADFARFPGWMWRNRDVVAFIEWLRGENDTRTDPAMKTRFVGLDLYSLRASMEAVVAYLDGVDPPAARRARERYACFDHVGGEGQSYAYALAHEGALPCEDEVVAQLVELRRRAAAYLGRDGGAAQDEQFFAEQNASSVTPSGTTSGCMTAAGRRGTCATGTWRARSARCATI